MLLFFLQINVFLHRLNGQPIGASVLGIFVIDKNTIVTVRLSLLMPQRLT